MRYFSTYGSDADVIRITGYLVKKSDIEKLDAGIAVQQEMCIRDRSMGEGDSGRAGDNLPPGAAKAEIEEFHGYIEG